MFQLDHYVRWAYMFKICCFALVFGLITLSVNNAPCLTVTAAPLMIPGVLMISDKIPRIIWLLIVVLSFVGLGLISQGEDYIPLDKKLGHMVKNYTAFYQSIAAAVLYLIGSWIGSRN